MPDFYCSPCGRYEPCGNCGGGAKHDADCLRRKILRSGPYLCTCGVTDEQVARAALAVSGRVADHEHTQETG